MLDGLERPLEQEQFTGERDVGGKKEICDAFGGVFDRFKHNCLKMTDDKRDLVSKSDLHDVANAYADYIDQTPEWNKQAGFTKKLTGEPGIGQAQSRQITGEKLRVFTGVQVPRAAIEELDIEVRQDRDDGSDSDLTSLV